MKPWLTLVVLVAAWTMAVALPPRSKQNDPDRQILQDLLQHYLEKDAVMNAVEEQQSQMDVEYASEEGDYEDDTIEEDNNVGLETANEELPSEKPVLATDEEYALEEKASTGFRHIYSLDMKIPTEKCPKTLQLRKHGSLRLCGKRKNGASCDSVIIPTYGKSYSRVRGRVRAYQYGSPDCFAGHGQGRIDSYYVDGISITHGKYPRKHVWTYAVAWRQYTVGSNPINTCPSTGRGRAQPGFVGDNYFCSSANPGPHWSVKLYPTPLWSNIQGDCSNCGDNDIFFCVNLPKPTSDNLEVRICTDEGLNNEDIRIESMDFYIQ